MGIVEVRDLWYTYPNASSPALKGINLTINSGEFIMLTGPSGCGKTTFCRCLNGLIPHFYNGNMAGHVSVAGLQVRDHPTTELAKHVGLIFQTPDNQIFALTVEKDVAFGLENLGVKKEEMIRSIDWAMDMTGIGGLRQRATHELSGGQKQRLAIASILAMRPSVVVLDEPTSFLDPVGAEKIFEVLRTLNEEHGMTVILIEHRVDLAARYVERVIVFDDGEIIDDGPTCEVFGYEESRLAGVGIPKIIQLGKRLSSRGVDLGGLTIDIDDFAERIGKITPSEAAVRYRRHRGSKGRDLIEAYYGEPVIEVSNVSYSYPSGVDALDDVSLFIKRGEFVAIMGENGAGKTTLVKHFNGLLKPKTGRVMVNGADVSSMSVASISRKVGLVFQNPDDQLFSENVEEEIRFGLRNFGFESGIIEKRVNWALNLLDIERYRKSSPFILSGGERKRVALASVLAWDPDVVVLDEPTIGQDYAQKERLRHFLMQLRTQGKTTIIVTHDVEFVADCRPRIVLMAKGRVIADGPTELVMGNEDALSRASVSPPEVMRILSRFSRFNLPSEILDVDEAAEVIYDLVKGVPS